MNTENTNDPHLRRLPKTCYSLLRGITICINLLKTARNIKCHGRHGGAPFCVVITRQCAPRACRVSLPLQGSYLNPGQITNKSPSARRARPRNIKFLQAILTAHHLSNIQTIAKMSEEADAPSAMALALENSSVSYEDLADIEKEFDDAETEISKFESHACLIF